MNHHHRPMRLLDKREQVEAEGRRSKRTLPTSDAVTLVRAYIESPPTTSKTVEEVRLTALVQRLRDEAESVAGLLYRLGVPATYSTTTRLACLARLVWWLRKQRRIWLKEHP